MTTNTIPDPGIIQVDYKIFKLENKILTAKLRTLFNGDPEESLYVRGKESLVRFNMLSEDTEKVIYAPSVGCILENKKCRGYRVCLIKE